MPANSTVVPPRPPQVNEALSRLEKICEEVSIRVTVLEDRLSHVRAPKPKDPSKDQLSRPILVPMAERIESSADFLAGIVRRLEELHTDLEI